MEKTTVSLNQIRKKNVWHFQPFSEKTQSAESALENSPYPSVRLKELVDKTAKGFPNIGGRKSAATDVPLLSVRNITSEGVVTDDNNKFISKQEHEKLSKSAVQLGDVLVTLFLREGRNVATVYDSEKPANLAFQLALLRLKAEKIDPRYLAAFLNSPIGRSLIFQLATGSVQRSLTINQLLNLSIPLLPSAEQQKLVERIKKMHML